MSDQAHFARALLYAELDVPAELCTWNQSDPAVRFAVYRNNVVVSRTDALADTFPVTQALVGKEFFRAMARVFLQANPVKTRVLTWLGARFADFVEAFPPACTLPYLADVARLEMLRVCAYHAADAQPIALQTLGQALADPDALSDLKLTLHPSAHLLQSPHAVWSLWAAHQDLLSIETVDPELAQTVLVFRRNLDVEVLNVSLAEGHFLMQLMAGAGLALAADAAVEHDQRFDLGAFMATLIRLQLITRISNGDMTP
ncbi:MAG: DNA-binding domain-containing protein [Gammaproteobacteria bacterium]|uniref:HvfC/BufC N-terminal domain-containing protein n=1 Tax=Rhodoferax sp. TaxID=50421 RepID=UPI001807B20C|nr:DNA-binding domain-containing protein [Rhodoferax sp.]MBU3900015.1 DNA-binding domain-containing protein [Gammaproteobacteria bacterium]MBA3059890.1 DUF2063 domain-containing protein [Rhodoferax sp.]MBU3997559.1 DNA-binding domain-containing protein [Gammaproteobacteria bacterium]MBU4017591.1 DNA-binding domain-containing protein [Gammaproteobacteria bacterium]MBU4081816.1 DNA-binding domain-containing protein [Gammaproteobacteria bacterium]